MSRATHDEWRTYSPRSYIYEDCSYCGAAARGPRGGMLALAKLNPGWQYRGHQGEAHLVRCPKCAAAGRDNTKGDPQ